jgi:hypothetical protein
MENSRSSMATRLLDSSSISIRFDSDSYDDDNVESNKTFRLHIYLKLAFSVWNIPCSRKFHKKHLSE